jgi:hypothetical protein
VLPEPDSAGLILVVRPNGDLVALAQVALKQVLPLEGLTLAVDEFGVVRDGDLDGTFVRVGLEPDDHLLVLQQRDRPLPGVGAQRDGGRHPHRDEGAASMAQHNPSSCTWLTWAILPDGVCWQLRCEPEEP